MVTLLDLFSENDQIKKWHQNLTDKKRQLMLGLSTSTKALAIASSLRQEDKIVLLTSTYGEEMCIRDRYCSAYTALSCRPCRLVPLWFYLLHESG